MLSFPADAVRNDDGGVTVTLPDVPEVVAHGADEREALRNAVGPLEAALNDYISNLSDIPQPLARRQQPVVAPGLLATLKLTVYIEMRAQELRRVDLARLMGTTRQEVCDMLDLLNPGGVDRLGQAAAALGGALEIRFR